MNLNQVLRQEHRKLGLVLQEDDHNLWLLDKDGKIIAIFTQNTDEQSILNAADKCLPPG